MKQILLTTMKELLNQGMKVQAIHAWGWFIRLLGSYAMKNRKLTNEMLKIPENTFSDLNPQVQIASQTNASKEEKGVQHLQKSRETSDKIQANGFLKSIRLVMTPLTGIISMIKLVLEPISEAIFHIGPESKSVSSWNLCLDLLDDFILAKCKDVKYVTSNSASHHLSATKFLRKQYSVKWLPWDILLRFIKKICEDVSSEGSDSSDLHHTCLRFIDTVTKELQPATLESPLYKVILDLKYIDKLQSVNNIRHAKFMDICSIVHINMVSPVVYLLVAYLCVVFQSIFFDIQNVNHHNINEGLCAEVESLRLDALIISSHLGLSTADYCVHHCPCHVIVVKLIPEILKISGKMYPSGMGYAILGSTIYCIGGRFPPNEPSLDVYIFDTKKNNEKSLTKLGPCLNAPKYYPNVVVIQGTWTALPEPDWDSRSPNTEKWIPYPHKFRVISHLIEDSKLILSTPEGIHIFDVTKPHAGRKHVHRYRGASHNDIPRDSVLADNDNICFTIDYLDTKFTAYNLSKDDAFANPLCVLNSYRDKLVYAFEKGYGKEEEHKHRQGQNVLQLTNVHSSMFVVPDGDRCGELIACLPL
uniref:Uncharacterized protein n=1 Tax=Quercus lobata TaxID=97700 RepID=A0A7N2MM72_QUELO